MAMKVLAALSSLLLFLMLQELALRSVFPVPEVSDFDRVHYSPQRLGDGRIQSTLGHASFRWTSDPDDSEFVHRLNLYGFRDDEWTLEKPSGTTRVAFVGDSFVEGFNSDRDNTIPDVFERLAQEHGRVVDGLNLGIGGTGPRDYARLIRDAIPLFNPDVVMLVFYENDLVSFVLDPETFESPPVADPVSPWQPEPRVVRLIRDYRDGRRVPRRWMAEPFAFIPPVPDPRNPWVRLNRDGALERIVVPDIARAMRAGRFNAALAGWFRWARRSLPRPVDFGPYLESVASFVVASGSQLAVVYIPTKSQVSDRYMSSVARYSDAENVVSLLGDEFQVHAAGLAASCARLSVAFLDLTPELRRREAAGQEMFWRYDDHFRPRGYRAAAEGIFSWWNDLQLGAARP